ncbi:MAG: RDD family protein [Phycisphaerales bacterium]|nr:RDD family protein [Phycisphaerales bacterium]
MRRRRSIPLVFGVLALCVLGLGPIGSGVGEHGWAVYQSTMFRVLIVHFPPRGTETTVEPGVVEPFRSLEISPEAIASDGDRLWMVFPPSIINGESLRRVSSVRAVRAFDASGWAVDPPDLLNAGPMLSGTGSLKRLVSDASGNLYALLKQVDRWALYSMRGDRWVEQTLPMPNASDWRLVHWDSSVLLLAKDPGGVTHAFELGEKDWNPIEIPGIGRVWDAPFVLGRGRDLVLGVHGAGGSLEIRVLTAGSDLLVHTIETAPSEPGAVLLEESNTLVLVSQVPDQGGRSRSVRLVEVDLNDGRGLFDGEPSAPSILGGAVFRYMLMMFIALGSVITLALLRPAPGGVFLVPNGWAIADPSRRFSAMLVDLFLHSAIIAPLFGVGILELATGNVLARPDSAWISLPVLLLAGAISSTILESTLGSTVGKKLLQIRVVRSASGPAERVAFSRVLLRNLIKWFLPPIAMLTIVEPGFRHRGDLAAGCVVVARAPKPLASDSGE